MMSLELKVKIKNREHGPMAKLAERKRLKIFG